MCVRVRVLSVVVFLDLVERIPIHRDFIVIMIPTTGINISDIRCFYKLDRGASPSCSCESWYFLNSAVNRFPCPRRLEFDVIVVMVTVERFYHSGCLPSFFTGARRRALPLFIALFLCSESNFIAVCDDFRDEKFRFKRVEWVAWVIFSIEGHGFYSILRRDIVDAEYRLAW